MNLKKKNLKNLMPKRNWFRVWSLSNYKFDQAYIQKGMLFSYMEVRVTFS